MKSQENIYNSLLDTPAWVCFKENCAYAISINTYRTLTHIYKPNILTFVVDAVSAIYLLRDVKYSTVIFVTF